MSGAWMLMRLCSGRHDTKAARVQERSGSLERDTQSREVAIPPMDEARRRPSRKMGKQSWFRKSEGDKVIDDFMSARSSRTGHDMT